MAILSGLFLFPYIFAIIGASHIQKGDVVGHRNTTGVGNAISPHVENNGKPESFAPVSAQAAYLRERKRYFPGEEKDRHRFEVITPGESSTSPGAVADDTEPFHVLRKPSGALVVVGRSNFTFTRGK